MGRGCTYPGIFTPGFTAARRLLLPGDGREVAPEGPGDLAQQGVPPPGAISQGEVRHQPGAGGQAHPVKPAGKLPVYPQGQGIGGHVIVVSRVLPENPVELLPVHGAQVPPQAQESREDCRPSSLRRPPKRTRRPKRHWTRQHTRASPRHPARSPVARRKMQEARARSPGPPLPGQEAAEAVLEEPGRCGPAQAPQDHQGNPPGRPRRPQVARCHTGPQAHEASQEPDPKGTAARLELALDPGEAAAVSSRLPIES